jgi:3-hydroxyisobutyrate dehydrogenase-like beta-hydroxyacid dehydrogenase
VTCNSALEAARQHAPHLTATHLYADLNSASPDVKRQVAAVVAATGALFVESAVMAPVWPHGHRVPMLLGGPGAAPFIESDASLRHASAVP